MIYNKQTTITFYELIDEIKKDYANQLDTYGWNFKENLEQFGETKYFLITNKFSTTKLTFDEKAKYIIRTSISDMDIERIQKLKEGL